MSYRPTSKSLRILAFMLLIACAVSSQGCQALSTAYRAKTFFHGQHLLMAEAIERNDMERLKQLAQG